MNWKNFKSNLINFIFSIAILIVPKPIYHAMYINLFVLWNTGYSNFSTYVRPNNCLHIDPGGTLSFPIKQITKLCGLKENTMFFLHKDQFHTKYKKNLIQINKSYQRLKFSNLEDKKKSNHSFVLQNQDMRSFNTTKLKYKTKPFQRIRINSLEIFGHLSQQNMESIFINKTDHERINHLVLPNHGQAKYLNKRTMLGFKKYKMLISGSQSRKYIHHPKTEKKLLKNKTPTVYKNIWGHLFFEVSDH